MTSKPNSQSESPTGDSSPQPRPPRLRSLLILILLGLGGGALYGWYFIYYRLSPTVAKSLSAILSRPVEMGELEAFSLTSLRFGKTVVPSRESYSEQVTIPAVEVDFTPLKLITQQTIELDVTLVKPDVQIEQTETGQWLTTQLTEQPAGFIEIKLKTLAVENADIALFPRNAAGKLQDSVNLTLPQLNSQFRDNNQRISFQLQNLSVANAPGNLNLEGEARLKTGEVDVAVTAKELAIGEFAELVTSPVDILEGNIDADTDIKLFLDGSLPTFQGTAQFNNIDAKLDQLTTPITDTNAQIRLSDQDIILEELTTNFGEVDAVAGGKINLTTGYDLTASIESTPISQLLSAVDVESSEIPISGSIEAKITVTGALENPQINITANSSESIQLDEIEIRRFQTELSVVGTAVNVENFQATPQTGGEITAQGKLDLTPEPNIALDVQLTDVSGEIIRSYQANLPNDLGTLNARVRVTGELSDLNNLQGDGSASFAIAGGTVTLPQLELKEGRFQALVNINQLQPEQLVPQVPSQFQNPVSGQFRLNANLADFSPEKVTLSGQGGLSVPQGELVATAITFQDGQFNANLQVTKIPLALFVPEVSLQWNELLSAQLSVSADVEEFDLNQIQGTGSGIVTIDGSDRAQIALQNLRLNQGNWQGDLQVSNFKVSQVVPALPPELQNTRVSSQLTAQGTLETLTPEGINLQGTAEVNQILGGNITANTIRLQGGEFQIVATPDNIELSQLSQQLQGNVAGEVTVNGNLDNLTPAGITAQANFKFKQGLALITTPLTTRLRWDGQQIILEQAEAENFFAEGTVALNLEKQGQEIVEQINLIVDAQQLDLAQLPLPRPEPVGKINVQGLADFSGNVTGSLKQPQAQGSIRLQNFAVERLTFDSEMVGGIQVNAQQGIALDLTGNSPTPDRIQLGLVSPDQESLLPLEPASFLIKRDEALAEGTRYDDELEVSLQDLPLDLLKDFAPLTEEFAQQPASGELEGELIVNLDNYDVSSGKLTLVEPSLGRFNSDRATANFTYLNNILTVKQATLIEQESEYRANGRLSLRGDTPDFEANLDIVQGRIEDILSALQIFDISDFNQDFATPSYGNAEDLDISSLNVENQPLETQLRRFSEIKALLAQLRANQDTTTAIPPLNSAQGNFTGKVNLQGTSFNLNDIQGEFSLGGDAWEWGPYQAQTVVAEGEIENGIITLLPIRLASGDSFINLSGTFGGENQSAQLQVNRIPIAKLQQIIELPELIGVSGFVNGTATVAGTLETPTARGELRVEEATLNETPVETIQGSFSYNNSQFNFFAEGLLSADSDPLTLTGDFPYQLPFATVSPPSDQLNIDINLQDDGFTLLDVISNGQLTWEGGEGEVSLAITGPFDLENFQVNQLNTSGVITLSEASIGTALIPEPLTNINSRVEFNFNQLTVQEFNADLGGGEVTAEGGLALFDASASSQTLNISLQKLLVNLPDLYEGQVSGNVNIAQTTLEPEIGGEITVSQGEVILAAQQPSSAEAPTSLILSNIGFSNLKINLAENLNVTRPPILNFLANGSLTVNGSLANLRPQGTISLERGRVNLGPTQFRLAQGHEQTAIFVPAQGLDPTLNVRLVTSVAETSGNITSESAVTEPTPGLNTGVGTLQSVQIEALVQGRASELQPGQLTANNDIITLSSDPNRSETEILALLGGGLTSGFGQGNTALGLANLAGSTFFGTFQNTIGDVLGLSEFRIFPTLIPTETEEGEEESPSSTLGLGAEAGIDISNDLSISFLTIFDAEQTIQYSIRYRLNDEILLRGITDLSDQQGLTIEYETRF